jgi:hypothetical protein
VRIQLKCGTEGRRQAIKASTLNGIDYLEVISPASVNRSPLLLLCFFKPFSGLDEDNVIIEGGIRKKNIWVEWARRTDDVTDEMLVAHEKVIIDNIKSGPKAQHFLIVRPGSDGDFSTYVLKLVNDSLNDRQSPPAGFDIILSGIDFSFKVECEREFDCRQAKVCPPNVWQEPIIDYMAKDFASFRLLMLDRLSSIIPDWKERNHADMGVMLIELLAYVGDHLSYYQDAAATESYLGTAKSRISARRIARLLDYYVNDGCNARTLVYFEVAGVVDLPAKTRLLTGGPDDPWLIRNEGEFQKAVNEGAKVFETMHDAKLYSDHNEIQFYTWGDTRCCLPRGATRATLKDDTPGGLKIKPGDVVVFEEIRSPEGVEHDEDPTHRQAVRLTEVARSTDPLNGSKVVDIAWSADDALAFPLCLWEIYDDPADARSKPVSVARGNVVFAEHGYTVEEDLALSAGFRYRPKLSQRPLTFKAAFDQTTSVKRILSYDARSAKPAVIITEHTAQDTTFEWGPVRDLLSSDRFRREFVVEMENDRTAQIRFGDDKHGMDPSSNINGIQPSMSASYSIGNGVEGNVGRNAIRRIVAGPRFDATSIHRLYNPIPAQGGSDPELLDEIRQNVPEAFMTQERAVIESDYVDVLKRHPDIQKAAASFRWTGSWLTVYVTVDRYGGKAVDDRFKTDIKNFLNQYRLAGYDVEVNGPLYVPLEIEMRVCIDQSHFREDVKKALLEAFANYDLASGERGFFHPDNFTFGQPVLLSRIYERAMKVDGVISVEITKLQRLGAQKDEGAGGAGLKQGFLKIGFTETARLDNDPNYPENGIIRVFVEGGR